MGQRTLVQLCVKLEKTSTETPNSLITKKYLTNSTMHKRFIYKSRFHPSLLENTDSTHFLLAARACFHLLPQIFSLQWFFTLLLSSVLTKDNCPKCRLLAWLHRCSIFLFVFLRCFCFRFSSISEFFQSPSFLEFSTLYSIFS